MYFPHDFATNLPSLARSYFFNAKTYTCYQGNKCFRLDSILRFVAITLYNKFVRPVNIFPRISLPVDTPHQPNLFPRITMLLYTLLTADNRACYMVEFTTEIFVGIIMLSTSPKNLLINPIQLCHRRQPYFQYAWFAYDDFCGDYIDISIRQTLQVPPYRRQRPAQNCNFCKTSAKLLLICHKNCIIIKHTSTSP